MTQHKLNRERMIVMLCTKCGAKNSDDALFCGGCGAPIGAALRGPENSHQEEIQDKQQSPTLQQQPSSSATKSKGNRIKIGILTAVVTVVVVLVGILAYMNIVPRIANNQVTQGEKYLVQKQYDEAIVTFEKAIKTDNKTANAYTGLADTYLALGNSQKAEESLQRGIEASPKADVLYIKLAELYDNEGQPEKAVQTLKTIYITGGLHLVYQVLPDKNGNAITNDDMDKTKAIIAIRVNELGASESVVEPNYDKKWILVYAAGIQDLNKAVQVINTNPRLTFRDTQGNVILEGDQISDAKASQGQSGDFLVSLTFNSDGIRKFAELTSKYIGQQIGIYVGDKLLTKPMIQTPILDGKVDIYGYATMNAADNDAALINFRSLPVSLAIINKSLIPSKNKQEQEQPPSQTSSSTGEKKTSATSSESTDESVPGYVKCSLLKEIKGIEVVKCTTKFINDKLTYSLGIRNSTKKEVHISTKVSYFDTNDNNVGTLSKVVNIKPDSTVYSVDWDLIDANGDGITDFGWKGKVARAELSCVEIK